jgi:glutathione S-transferase
MSWNAVHLQRTLDARRVRVLALAQGAALDEKKHGELLSEAGLTLAVLDRHLRGRSVIVGETLTIADIAVGTNVFFGVEEGLKLDSLPNVRAWLERTTSRPAWTRAQP